jgi:cardiolipin synthase A/B
MNVGWLRTLRFFEVRGSGSRAKVSAVNLIHRSGGASLSRSVFPFLFPFALASAACSSTDAPSSVPEDVRRNTPDAAAGDAAPGVDGALPPTPNTACEALSPRSAPLELHTFPDDGEAPYVDALASAKKSIRVMVYMMGFGGILDTLVAQARAGVSVQVILDGNEKRSTNQKYFDTLTAAGASVHWSDPKFSYMHAKVLVVDDALSVISTGNYSKSFLLKERNYAVTDRDPEDVRTLSALFDADFVQREPDLSCTRLLVSPVNAKERLVALVKSAQTEILVESMQYAYKEVQDAIAERQRAGVSVRVILADPGWIDANAAAGAALVAAGIAARQTAEPTIHVKAITVDGKRAYLGSENLSYTSLSKNREIGVETEDPALVAKMNATFERDWAVATPF